MEQWVPLKSWELIAVLHGCFQKVHTSLGTRTVSSDGTQGSEPRSSVIYRLGVRASNFISFMFRIYSPYFEEFGVFFFGRSCCFVLVKKRVCSVVIGQLLLCLSEETCMFCRDRTAVALS